MRRVSVPKVLRDQRGDEGADALVGQVGVMTRIPFANFSRRAE
jgi:hypothetical protein